MLLHVTLMVWFLEYSVSDSFAYCESNNCLVGWTVDRSIDQSFGLWFGRSVDGLVGWSVFGSMTPLVCQSPQLDEHDVPNFSKIET